MVLCRVLLLDGNDFETDINRNAEGRELFDEVCKKLCINEKEYFGLTYTGAQDVKYWVNHDKKIAKQVKSGTWVFEFAVKFYPPEPSHLSEDVTRMPGKLSLEQRTLCNVHHQLGVPITETAQALGVTRYQLCLQIRADIYNGKLPCSFMTHAILGSYTVQAEIGDYDPQEDGPGDDYLKAFDFAPQQTPELSQKIHELHKTHKGQTPEEAELNFLENAKKLAMYGVDLHKAKDSENRVIMLGVCASGLQLYREKLRINRFVWPKIIKLTYKRNNFYIKLRQTEGDQETTICFKLDSHKLAKRLWKTCVEHHTFFRLKEPEKNSTGTLIPRFNSRFRYSGRTQKQIREQEDLMDRPKVKVERRGLGNSFRMPRDAEGHIIRPVADAGADSYDRTDKLAGHTDTMSSGPPPYSSMDRGDKHNRRPGETEPDRGDMTEDRRDKMLGNHDKTEGAPGEGGDAALLEEGGALHGAKKSKEDKEREKREKEEEKRRQKEAEKEKKRLEKEKKKNKDNTEDRADRLGGEDATETAINGTSGTMGLDSDAVVLGKSGNQEGNKKPGDGDSAPKMGENLEHVKHDKAHDKHKDKKEAKKGGGLFGMLKKTPSKGKGDKAKPTETEVNNKDSPSRGDQQTNKKGDKSKKKQTVVIEETIEDEVFVESVDPVMNSNSKLVSEVKDKSNKSGKKSSSSSSSSSSSDEGEIVLEHRGSNIVEEVCSNPSSPTQARAAVVLKVDNKNCEHVEGKAGVESKKILTEKSGQQSDSQKEDTEVTKEHSGEEKKVEIKLKVNEIDKRSSNPPMSETSKSEGVTSVHDKPDNAQKPLEEKPVAQEEVRKKQDSPLEVPVVLLNEESGKEEISKGSSEAEEKKGVGDSKEDKKKHKEEEKRHKEEEKKQKEEEKRRKKLEQLDKKKKEKEEKERKKKEKLEAKKKKEVKKKQEEEVPEMENGGKSAPPTEKVGAENEDKEEETRTESKPEEHEVKVKIKVLPKSDTDTSLLGQQEVCDDKAKEEDEKLKEEAKEPQIDEKDSKEKVKDSKKTKSAKSKKKQPVSKKKSSTGCFSFVRHHKSSESEDEAAKIELPTEPWPTDRKEAEEVEKPAEEHEVKTPPKQRGGVGMGWALPGMNELKDRKAKPEDTAPPLSSPSSSSSDEDISHHAILDDDADEQGGFGLDGSHPDYSDKSIDRKMQFIAVTPPSTEVRDRQRGDNTMPFFESVGSTSDGEGEGTLGKKKPPPVAPKKYRDSQDDRLGDMPPTVATERMRYDPNTDDQPIPTTNVPIVKTQTRTVTYEKDGFPVVIEDGILISSQSHSTRTQTIETTTYKTERDGKTETRVEKKVVISQEENGDDIDHDALLAEAIKSVTEMNPDLSVERIECMRQIEDVDGGREVLG